MEKYFKVNGQKVLVYASDDSLESARQTFLNCKFMTEDELEKYSYNQIEILIKDSVARIKYHIKNKEVLKNDKNILSTCTCVCHYSYKIIKINEYRYQLYFDNEY